MINNDISSIVSRIEHLEAVVFGNKTKPKKVTATPRPHEEKTKLDYSVNIRAFVKRFVAGKSGPKKFVLLLAYLAKEDVKKNIALSDVRKEWNKMSAKNLLGKFNRFYPNEAKTQGWVDPVEYGTYRLAEGWKKINE